MADAWIFLYALQITAQACIRNLGHWSGKPTLQQITIKNRIKSSFGQNYFKVTQQVKTFPTSPNM
jgi:hypothetical protein